MRIRINGVEISAKTGSTILQVARENHIYVPTLCYLKDLNQDSLCRMCVVEVKGNPKLQPACSTKISEGMEICTDSQLVIQSRKRTLDFICRHHRMDCEYCPSYTVCELHKLVREYGLDDRIYAHHPHNVEKDDSTVIVKDYSKCIQCRRCEAVCNQQTVNAIWPLNRAADTKIGTVEPLADTNCVSCGQCLKNCPTGALSIRDDSKQVWNVLRVEKKQVIAVIDPYIGEAVGGYLHCADKAEGRLAAILRKIGFAEVYKSATAVLPDGIGTRCPAVAAFIKNEFPQYAEKVVVYPSPTAASAIACRIKYTENTGIPESEVAVVVLTGCTCKDSLRDAGADFIMTAQDLIRFIEQACVSKFTMLKLWRDVEPEPFVEPNVSEESSNRVITISGLCEVRQFFNEKMLGNTGSTELFACSGGCAMGGGL